MNKTINEGSLPVDWKHAGVKPVRKAGSKSDPLNYLPISVWSVHRMVYSYLQCHRLLSLLQSGFRPLHPTSTCVTLVTNALLENIDKGLLTGLIFLDLSKAFDSLDHSIMLDKLTSLGMNRSAVQWIRCYWTICAPKVFAQMRSCMSPSLYLSGSPQGGVLGPVLFITYINDLLLVVRACSVELYDDTLIYFASTSVSQIQTCLMLYNTMVLALFDNCLSVWDNCGVGSKSCLGTLNRGAACIIEVRPTWANESKLTLDWPSRQSG